MSDHSPPQATAWSGTWRARPRPCVTRGSCLAVGLLPLLGHEPHDAGFRHLAWPLACCPAGRLFCLRPGAL